MSEYKDIAKILIEGPFADDEKQDAGADRVGRDDGDTWQAPNGDIGGKYSGEIRYFDDEDQATAWAKSGKGDSKGDDSDSGDKEKEEPAGKLGTGDFDRDGGDSDDTAGGNKKTGFVSKNKPQPAKDLANDPKADTGPDSRGTEWDASYYGADDSAEWEDQYRDAEEDGDEEELAQIKWFGEKQGWGKDGELPSKSARTGKELGKNETLKIDGKMYRKVQEQKETTTDKHPLRESYERIGGK